MTIGASWAGISFVRHVNQPPLQSIMPAPVVVLRAWKRISAQRALFARQVVCHVAMCDMISKSEMDKVDRTATHTGAEADCTSAERNIHVRGRAKRPPQRVACGQTLPETFLGARTNRESLTVMKQLRKIADSQVFDDAWSSGCFYFYHIKNINLT